MNMPLILSKISDKNLLVFTRSRNIRKNIENIKSWPKYYCKVTFTVWIKNSKKNVFCCKVILNFIHHTCKVPQDAPPARKQIHMKTKVIVSNKISLSKASSNESNLDSVLKQSSSKPDPAAIIIKI